MPCLERATTSPAVGSPADAGAADPASPLTVIAAACSPVTYFTGSVATTPGLSHSTSSDIGATGSDEVRMRRLNSGMRARRKLRLCIGCTMLALSGFAGLGAACLFGRHIEYLQTQNGMQEHVAVATSSLCYAVFHLCLALAPLPDDRCFTRVMLVVDMFLMSFLFLQWEKHVEEKLREAHHGVCFLVNEKLRPFDCYWQAAYSITRCLGHAVFVLGCLIAFACTEADRMQQMMWRTIASFCLLDGCAEVIDIMYWGVCHAEVSTDIWFLLRSVLMAYVAQSPHLRQKLRRWLGQVVAKREAAAAASGIAGLLGNCSTQQALRYAKLRFRGVKLSDLPSEVFADNTPMPCLSRLALSISLGACDAFVSHSWQDSPREKFDALQRWRSAFLQAHGREPLVWFDKCCVNQTDIEADLRCLPIYLSGCKELLLLCGHTYLSRLWCIIEIFTFVHMGGDLGSIRVFPLLREGREVEDLVAIRTSFERFDVRRCQCTKSRDRRKFMLILDTAIGGVHGFNLSVREIMRGSEIGLVGSMAPQSASSV
eukprot:TRINITY_DN45431_c0_g1_i1.p1 TRINITY_DN45431_c0_g1~~TRINITY_DN45431_c0_g1_i1.p1  ORF type:complete len:541 (-),score=72.20 TRINITY_DN45431_c0_g1_i1:333-1955(-)